jgi:hypothetical protein
MRIPAKQRSNKMKTLLLFAVLSVSECWLLGQTFTPQVDFNNHRAYATIADRDVYGLGWEPLVGTQYRAQLYYGATAESLQAVTAAPASFRDPANIPAGSALGGTWIGGTRVLTGFNAGDIVVLQVRVWDSTTGADFASAFLKFQSATFTYTVPPVGALPNSFYMENLRSFGPIPEPPVLGLGVIGVGALLMVHRRVIWTVLYIHL